MIYSACIIDSQTKVMIMRVQVDSDAINNINLPIGTELASRHDGDFGWILQSDDTWLNPNPPLRYTKAQGVRNRRDYKLKNSDKYAYPDYPQSEEKRTEWLSYRQALRDVTAQPGFPDTVIWPTKPS